MFGSSSHYLIRTQILSLTSLLLIHNSISGWVDPDTQTKFYTTTPLTKGDDREYKLVFSDEFEVEGRSFKDGEDSRWTALDKNDYTNDALHYYKSENVNTTNGVMNITTNVIKNDYRAYNEKTKKYYLDTKHIQSAMVQGWNKFCLTGGIIEYSAKLPGTSSVGGMWPALWLLGNLARATFVGSSNWMWPFSYDVCDPKKNHQQEINACRNVGHYGMKPGIGRGAPEIDILEAMGGEKGKLPNTPIQRPYFSTSYQVAPGFEKRPALMHQPKPGFWYDGLEYGNPNTTSLNPFFYGVKLVHKEKAYTYQSDAISANTQIDESHYQNFNRYRVEWDPPTPGNDDGYIKWFLNDEFLYGIGGHSLNVTSTKVPDEPMYLIMNTAVASSWGFPIPCPEECDCSCFECGNPDCDCGFPDGFCDNLPANFEIDYVRVYQAVNESKHQLGCSTDERPTSLFVEGHKERYMEDGDKKPLQPLRIGGGRCNYDADCGVGGTCLKGQCRCAKQYAGSTCLSHLGFDDHQFDEHSETLVVSKISIPASLGIILGISIIGVIISSTVIARGKKIYTNNENEVNKIVNLIAPTTTLSKKYGSMIEGSQEYLEQSQHREPKVITYCMIDGRLIDK